MQKNLKSKILLSILAASVFYLPACANAASLEITNATQATDSTISDWLHDPIRGHSGKAIYHEAEADGNQLSVTGEPEFLKDYTDLTAAYKKIGDNSSYDLEKNEVSITGGNFSQTRYFYGAYGNMRNVQGGTANLTGNNLTISGGNYNIDQLVYYYLYGAYADLYTATDNSEASLTGNSVILKNDATFNKRAIVYGAYANFNDSSDASNFNAAASLADNTVTVNGGQYNSGASFHGAYATLMTANLNAQPADTAIPTVNLTGNKVTVSNTAFNNSNNIYGAYINLQDANGMYNNDKWDTGEFNITAVLQNNSVTVDSSTFNSNDTSTYNTRIYGANADLFYAVNSKADLLNNTVAINGGKFETATNVYGAYINLDHNGISKPTYNNNVNSYDNVASTVSGNNVTISGGEFNAATNVYGAYADLTYNQNTADNVYPAERYYTSTAAITDNTVTLTGSAGAYDEATQARDLKNVNLYGYGYNETDKDVKPDDQITAHSNNNLIVDGWSGTVGSVNNFDAIDFENIKVAVNSDTPAASVFNIEDTNEGANKGLADTKVNINSVAAGDYAHGTELSGTLTLDKDINYNKIEISDKLANYANKYFASDNDDNGVVANAFSSLSATKNPYEDGKDHVITISATVKDTILAGKFIDAEGKEHINSNGEASLTVDESLNNTYASIIAGAYAAGKNEASGGKVYMAGNYQGAVYAGYSEGGDATGNEIILTGNANVTDADLYGGGSGKDGAKVVKDNKLTIDDWKGKVNSLNNFAAIDFNNIAWENDSTVLTIADTDADLSSTAINLNSLKGGSTIKAGDTMTFVASKDDHDLKITDVKVDKDKFLAGVALEGEGTYSTENGSLTFTINTVELTPQTDIVAETHAATAAFVNQGTDLINDSLDVLGRDGTYGVKTFAAVHGNRSKYDVADDLKINGWSTIVGVGNADKFDNGSELSWGVFYENGSGNYRTYNSFNNEFFRGDGSMVYNGGGIAARYENKNGVYTEGSLRAGMLKNELDNAMRDVNGSYGYETESAYYGAHIGVGKIIRLSDSSDLDIYGKFFHTYTEGDSVTIADDKFDFDSITSDRLRVGARITSNKENKFSTYYGLAYEYEFNGDADMTAAGIKADTQSFGGGTGIAELGFNYQPGSDSPWNFDLNLRGYVGERQGGSFNVQATYTF